MCKIVKTSIEMYLHRKSDGSETLSVADLTQGGKSEFWTRQQGACLGKVKVACEYESPDIDASLALIDALEGQIRAEQAESYARVTAMQDRIAELRCITHQAEVQS